MYVRILESILLGTWTLGVNPEPPKPETLNPKREALTEPKPEPQTI